MCRSPYCHKATTLKSGAWYINDEELVEVTLDRIRRCV
jgi:hypothetical protein